MQQEKAYKLLAKQQDISHKVAKRYIDNGLVSLGGQCLQLARTLVSTQAHLTLTIPQKAKIIFEDTKLLVLEKPIAITSESLAKQFNYSLIHRLDKGTSGILLLAKKESFRQTMIAIFNKQAISKTYVALVQGRLVESKIIDSSIKTIKTANKAKSFIDKTGKSAYTSVQPLAVFKQYSKVLVHIQSGRTHQIRLHLQSIGHSVLGDHQYANKNLKAKKFHRLALHHFRCKFLDYALESKDPFEELILN